MDILDFIEEYEPVQQSILHCLHAEFIAVPGIVLKSRYKLPFYYRHSWIAYVNPLKTGGVELCFTKGYLLSNQNDLLEARGRTMIMGVVYRSVDEVNLNSLRETFQEAIMVDEETRPKSSKRMST